MVFTFWFLKYFTWFHLKKAVSLHPNILNVKVLQVILAEWSYYYWNTCQRNWKPLFEFISSSFNTGEKSRKPVLVNSYNFEHSECLYKKIHVDILFFPPSLQSILVEKNKFWMEIVEKVFV